MSTVTKRELVERITEKTQARQALVKTVVQQTLNSIAEELAKGNRLEFRNFGVFETTDRPTRTGQNPNTLERVHVPAKRMVRFKAGRLMLNQERRVLLWSMHEYRVS